MAERNEPPPRAPEDPRPDGGEGEEPPPFGRSWRRLYALVLSFLAFQVVLYAVFAKAFR